MIPEVLPHLKVSSVIEWEDIIPSATKSRLCDLVDCNHETVKFFHRRIDCRCLKDLYYELKDKTPRTSFCPVCYEVKEISLLKECQCKQVQYCSKECVAKFRPEH
jgi:hypothetical protein